MKIKRDTPAKCHPIERSNQSSSLKKKKKLRGMSLQEHKPLIRLTRKCMHPVVIPLFDIHQSRARPSSLQCIKFCFACSTPLPVSLFNCGLSALFRFFWLLITASFPPESRGKKKKERKQYRKTGLSKKTNDKMLVLCLPGWRTSLSLSRFSRWPSIFDREVVFFTSSAYYNLRLIDGSLIDTSMYNLT